MIDPTAVYNTLISERLKARAGTNQRARTAPPPAFVTTARPPSAQGARAQYAYSTYIPPLRTDMYPDSYQAQPSSGTPIRDWGVSQTYTDPAYPQVDKTFTSSIGGPSPKLPEGAPLNKGSFDGLGLPPDHVGLAAPPAAVVDAYQTSFGATGNQGGGPPTNADAANSY